MTRLVLVIIFSFLCLTFQTTAADLIDEVCGNGNVTDRGVCESTLRADPRSRTPFVVVLLEISLRATIDKLEATQRQIDYLIKTSTNPDSHKSLKECEMLYAMSGDKLHESMGDIGRQDYGQLYVDMTVATSNTLSCESAFKLPTSLLSTENTDFGILCSNVVGIAKQVPL